MEEEDFGELEDGLPDEEVDGDDGTDACPSCGTKIYADAERCPHCGDYVEMGYARDPGWPLWMKIGAVLAVTAVGVWILFWVAGAMG